MSQDQIYFLAGSLALPAVLVALHAARTRITLGPFFGVAGVYSLMLWQMLQTGWWVGLGGYNFNAALTLFIPPLLQGFLFSIVLDGLRTARAYALMVLATSAAAWAFSLFREALAQHVPLPYLIVLSNREHLAIILGLLLAQTTGLIAHTALRRRLGWGALPAAQGASVATWLIAYSLIQFDAAMAAANLGNEATPFLLAALPSLVFVAAYGLVAQRLQLLMPARDWASLFAFWKPAESDGGGDELTNRDRVVSELRLLNQQLAQDSRILQTHLEQAAYGILIVGADGRVLRANGPAATLLGVRGPEGRPVETLLQGAIETAPTLDRLLHDKEQRCRLRGEGEAGRWIDIVVTPLDSRQAEPRAGYYFILKDVTAAVQAERRRLVASRIQDLHQTGRVLAHDFSNLLIGAQAQLGRLKAGNCNAEQRAALEAVELALRRGRELLQQLGAGSQFGAPRLERQDLAALLDEAVAICAAAAAEAGVRIERRYTSAWPVEADASQMVRVFTNLLKNAIRASGEGGGTIGIGIARQGTGVVVTIDDQGCGLPDEQLAAAFDPGFSTKGEGKGGLGLAISYLMVDAHGGQLELERNPAGRGLRAKVWLPEVRGREMNHADLAGSAVIVATPVSGSADVLLAALERQGCRVAEAASWDEIHALLAEDADWQLLLLDPSLDDPGERSRLPPALQVRTMN